MRWRKRCIHTHIYVHVYIKCTSDISFPREYFCRKKKRAREKDMTRYRITCIISAYRCNHSDRIVAGWTPGMYGFFNLPGVWRRRARVNALREERGHCKRMHLGGGSAKYSFNLSFNRATGGKIAPD